MEQEKEIIKRFKKYGQEHVFRFWPDLSAEQRSQLISQAENINLELMQKLSHEYINSPQSSLFKGILEPAEIIRIPKTERELKWQTEAKELGEKVLQQEKVATLLVAGGQATRLGYQYPKGMYPIGPVSGKTLFQLHAEKIRARANRCKSTIPWYIMTSETNHAETIKFFEDNNFFGLGSQDIFFFKQGMIPALNEHGKLLLNAKDHIFVNPDGHGGALSALKRSGALADMAKRGIELLFYFQVDNVLNNICDPIFLGYHILENAEMSAKVVRKRFALEKVGLIGKINGRTAVIEYSDMSDEDKKACGADGSLKYWAGSIAIHVFNVEFIERENEGGLQLPFHVAHKKINYIDETGKLITPDESNGYKFEQFVFDALGDSQNSAIMEVERSKEFSPVKNSHGESSPETAKQDMIHLHVSWLENAGLTVPRNSDGNVPVPVEISPLFALEAGDISGKSLQTIKFDRAVYLE